MKNLFSKLIIRTPQKKIIVNTFHRMKFYLFKYFSKFKRFCKNNLKINSKIYKPEVFYFSVKKAGRNTLIAITILFFSNIFSLFLISYGLYLIFTTEYPAVGGTVNIVSMNDKIDSFNPLLDLGSDTEEQVSNLIFSPLYDVENGEIKPILIETEPKFTNDGKTLEFNIKENVYWSNGEPITSQDIEYSFERLKEKGGNKKFHLNFQALSLVTVNDKKFEINLPYYNEDYKKLLNFQPISSKYFNGLRNEGLKVDAKSYLPAVTSGQYQIKPFAKNPLTSDEQERQNPIRNNKNDFYVVVLTKQEVKNIPQTYYPSQITFIIVDSIDNSQESKISVENINKSLKIDIFNIDINILKQNQIFLESIGYNINNLKSVSKEDINYENHITNLNKKNTLLEYQEFYNYFKCVYWIEFDFKENSNCPNPEEDKKLLLALKDKRGLQIFTFKGGKLLFYGKQITMNAIISDSLNTVNIEKSLNNLQLINFNIVIKNNIMYKNLVDLQSDYDLVIFKTNINMFGLNKYNQNNGFIFSKQTESKSVSQKVFLANDKVKYSEQGGIYINTKRW